MPPKDAAFGALQAMPDYLGADKHYNTKPLINTCPASLIIDSLRYIFLKLWLKLLALLPLSWLHALGRGLGLAFSRLPNRARSTTEKNLRTCFPGRDERWYQAMCRDSLQNTACTALEMGKAWMNPVSSTLSLVVESEGYEQYRQAVDSGDGVILLAPHLSNWEIFGFYACDEVAATFMYQPPRRAAMDRLLKEVRSRSGVSLAPTNRRGVAQLLSALQRGEMVGVLPDQVPADSSGEFAPFFGEPAFTMTLISKLAQRTGARIFCGFALRLPRGRGFRAIFREADPAIASAELLESVTALNRTVEQCVELAPSQYQWEYKRFRRRPDNSEFY
jgi:KDO2-lipid IV(A) lauroyltransferase